MAEALPKGVVTFLFSDIEGSTKLWERCPEPMHVALPEHDRILRESIERHAGVVFKTAGDGFCSAFEHPGEALAAAIEAQRALRAHSWPEEVGELRIRMGIHSGECTRRDGDYFGTTVNRVARLTSIAHGEQILLSAAAAALLRDSLPPEVTLRDLGSARLKDLSQLETAFQVVAPGLRSTFPLLASLDSRPNNLPSQLSSFVGRDAELERAGELIAQTRLLTIAGPGGIGKTRLTLQLAADLADRYPDGVWFVDLTAIRNPDLIPQTVAAAFGVRELPNEAIETTLLSHLGEKTLLLVIDNAEHLLAGAARFVKALLGRCPAVTVLATSREPLHLAGEQIYRLGPLMEPTRLFLERARRAAPAMVFGEEERAEVISLCERLEGVPLAIELACARLASMPLKQLARRLGSGLNLTSRDLTESSHHRALRETIEWSYRLLEPEEQSLLAELSVFHGGCAVGAMAAVAPSIANLDDVVDSLVDKSLISVDDSGAEERYWLLGIVREYAGEQLRASGAAEGAERNHALYYADLVSATATRSAEGKASSYAVLDSDAPNVRAALEWMLVHDASGAMRLIVKLAPYWRIRGNVTEARYWMSRALDAGSGDAADRAAVLCLAASFATLQDELTESLRLSDEALKLYRTAGDSTGIATALFHTAVARHCQGQLNAAETLYRESLGAFSHQGDAQFEMLCIGNLGMLARQRGDFRDAFNLLDDAIRRATRLNEERILGEFTMQMGWVQLGLNDLQQSRGLFERAFADKSRDQDRYGVCYARHGLATVALKEERLREALEEFLKTLDAATELRLKDYVARALHGIAAVEALDGEIDLAARLLGLTDRLFDESGRELRDSIAYEIASKSVNAATAEAQRLALREEGARMSVDDALAAVRALRACAQAGP